VRPAAESATPRPGFERRSSRAATEAAAIAAASGSGRDTTADESTKNAQQNPAIPNRARPVNATGISTTAEIPHPSGASRRHPLQRPARMVAMPAKSMPSAMRTVAGPNALPSVVG